jgi:2-polyprenyl-3-methyl-5-hydroxy-6-metoxy-1,4-benzoquinol methylase
MLPAPWWVERVDALLSPEDLSALDVGQLWNLAGRVQFVEENVDPALREIDCERRHELRATWSAFEVRRDRTRCALEVATAKVIARIYSGELGPDEFRSTWEGLGFTTVTEGAGTPADDYLDAVLGVSRLTTGEARGKSATVNLSSRAYRVADFLATLKPTRVDTVYDLGSGSGKLALTVAASTDATVRGIELGATYVTASQRCAERLNLRNVNFICADVNDVDLSQGSIFYLYYPFHGAVAQAVAAELGRLARTRPIAVYSSGPANEYGEYFLDQVANGSLVLSERRGEFAEVMVLRSARV